MRSRGLRVGVAALVAGLATLSISVSPAAAECIYVPPWPAITPAISSAREIIVGEVTSDFDPNDLPLAPDQAPRDYALRVLEVLRGNEKVGRLRDVQYLLPNWPQTILGDPDRPTASCTSLLTRPGETIALAYDALQLGGRMRDGDHEWIQPPTRYHAVGVIEGASGLDDPVWERELVTIEEVRRLAALPRTDSAAQATSPSLIPIVAIALGLVAGLLALRARGRASSPTDVG